MENMPVLSEFVQYGVIGICLALITQNGFQTWQFVKSLLTFAEVTRGFTASVEKLNERIERLEDNHKT
jgi:hypothetical protein